MTETRLFLVGSVGGYERLYKTEMEIQAAGLIELLAYVRPVLFYQLCSVTSRMTPQSTKYNNPQGLIPSCISLACDVSVSIAQCLCQLVQRLLYRYERGHYILLCMYEKSIGCT